MMNWWSDLVHQWHSHASAPIVASVIAATILSIVAAMLIARRSTSSVNVSSSNAQPAKRKRRKTKLNYQPTDSQSTVEADEVVASAEKILSETIAASVNTSAEVGANTSNKNRSSRKSPPYQSGVSSTNDQTSSTQPAGSDWVAAPIGNQTASGWNRVVSSKERRQQQRQRSAAASATTTTTPGIVGEAADSSYGIVDCRTANSSPPLAKNRNGTERANKTANNTGRSRKPPPLPSHLSLPMSQSSSAAHDAPKRNEPSNKFVVVTAKNKRGRTSNNNNNTSNQQQQHAKQKGSASASLHDSAILAEVSYFTNMNVNL